MYFAHLYRYNIERKWQDIIKSNNDVKRMNKKKTEKQLTYWDYQARRMNRAVTEPNIQTIRILGTDILQKSNSFHELHNFKQQPNPPAELFKPKLVTWLYVTKAQCYYINFTRTDTDLIKVFGMSLTRNLHIIIIRTRILFEGVLKYYFILYTEKTKCSNGKNRTRK